jgi:acyl-CoA synthetase (AMP-forming)/AMP-acid ligase II
MLEVTGAFVRRAGAEDWPAVIDDDGTHPAGELLAAATTLSGALRDAVGSRPTVLIQAENSWRTVAASLAVGQLGGALALASEHTTPAEFAAICEDVAPDVVVAAPGVFAGWQVQQRLAGAVLEDGVLDGWRVGTAGTPRDAGRWAGGVLIGLTSGSTGRPKGVVQSESALRYAAEQEIAVSRLVPGDPVAAIVPLSSTASYCFGVYAALLLGGPLVLSRRWDPAGALAQLRDTGARWTMCVPTQVLQLAAAVTADQDAPLRELRSITVGGGPMQPEALRRAEDRLGTRILRAFGMSECLGHTSPRLDEPAEVRLAREGYPFPGTEVRAVGPDGRPREAGRAGAAQVRGPSLFLGYASGGALAPVELTPDGFFATGDVIVVEPDGAVRVTGRIKDMIIRGGRNIDVVEVEQALSANPGIDQVCVVPVPDDVLGERVAALVVTSDPGAAVLGEVTARLAGYGLAKTKWPEFVYRVPEIPQTRVGKVARAEARRVAIELYDAAKSTVDETAS